MNRKTLIDKIVFMLDSEGVLDIGNYMNTIDQTNDVKKIIERCLDDYVIIKGHVI